jgi:hypothetical protein
VGLLYNYNNSFLIKKINAMNAIKFYDKRMLQLMEYIITSRTNDITTKTAFLLSIGFNSTANMAQIKSGAQSFRIEHFVTACKKYNINANWFLDADCKVMNREGKKTSTIDVLRQAVSVLASEYAPQK